MEFHEYANLFPMSTKGELAVIVEDMQANGYNKEFPIILYEGKILDGRNRYKAANEANVKPVYKNYNGKNPLGYILLHNAKHRHMNESRRAVVASRLANMPNHRLNKSANLRTYISQSEAARLMNVSERIIQTIKEIERNAPDLIASIECEEMTAHEAHKKIKEKKRKKDLDKQRQEIEEGVAQLPEGTFEVLVIDPPWPYGTEYDADGRRAANPYPEMSLEQIMFIPMPSSKDCVMWLWTTHKFMRYSFMLLDAWGFRDVAILTWVKDKMGLGSWLRSKSEFCIMAVKGKPSIDLTNQTTVIFGKMREHSRKPEEFYQMVDELCIGRKLDYFSREERKGWSSYGNDVERFTKR